MIFPGYHNGEYKVTAPDGINTKSYNLELERLSNCWSIIGSRGISSGAAENIQLKSAPDGTQYLAFSDKGDGGKILVKKRFMNSWISVGGGPVSDGEAKEFSLSFLGNIPWIAYTQGSANYSDDLNVEDGGILKVKKLENNSWVQVGQILKVVFLGL